MFAYGTVGVIGGLRVKFEGLLPKDCKCLCMQTHLHHLTRFIFQYMYIFGQCNAKRKGSFDIAHCADPDQSLYHKCDICMTFRMLT